MRAPLLPALLLLTSACPADPSDGRLAVEIDNLRTVAAVIGGDPSVTAVVYDCDHAPDVIAWADDLAVAHLDAVPLFHIESAEGSEPETTYGAGTAFLQFPLPAAALEPRRFGLPASFDLQVEVHCGRRWASSPVFPMIYLPTVASTAPPFNPVRFWVDATPGDLLVCEGTELVRYLAGATPAERLDVGFPCAVTNLSEDPTGRRYLDGDNLGIAAIDPGPVLAWTRPMLLTGSWTDPTRDPVVLREEGAVEMLVVLDRETGADRVGPLPLAHTPFGRLARDSRDEIVVLEGEVTVAPDRRTYWVQRFAADGTELGSLQVAHYAWKAPSYVAEFDDSGETIYVAAAPESEAAAWIEKVSLTTGASLWSTSPAAGWRFPLGESGGRVIVASDDAFAWLDPDSGLELSQPFAPDSGKTFVRGFVEEDGSVVMLADPSGGVAQGLYLFAPDGRSIVRFHTGSALFRFLSPGWGGGSLVSYFDELHWLNSRANYDASLNP